MGFEVPEDDGEDLPSWLQDLQTGDLGGPAASAPEESEDTSSDSDELPDWLDAPVAESAPATSPEEKAEDIPDWLGSIREAEGNTGALPADVVAEPEPAEGEAPAWLETIREKEGTGQLPADALDVAMSEGEDAVNPDWLSGIRDQEGVADESEPAIAEVEDDASGNFMDRIQELKEEDDGLLTQADEPEEDWLSGLGDSETGSLFAPTEESAEPDAMDWLAEDGDKTELASESALGAAFEDLAPADADKPDWLGGVSDAAPLPGAEVEIPEDELSAVAEDAPTSFDPEITDAFIASAESVDDVFPDLPGGGEDEGVPAKPSWLDNLTGTLDPNVLSGSETADEQASEEDPMSTTGAFTFSVDEEFSLDDESLPSWLSDIEPEEPQIVEDDLENLTAADAFAVASGGTNPFAVADEAPELPAFETDDELGEAAAGDENIERADLPSWLQAMRPVGAVTPSETDQHTISQGDEETIGPLAGLRGVLPAEPAIVQFGDEVSEQSTGLRILAREERQARMLHKLVQMEDKARPMKRQGGMIVHKLFKSLTGLAMYLLVFAVMFLNLKMSAYPNVFSDNASAAQVRNTFELIEGRLQAGPVLIVFDYDPAFIGEMNAAASGLILQLAMQDRSLVLVTTNPAGAALAEEFMSLTSAKISEFGKEVQYHNMGLIAGGGSGVLNFAYNPRTVTPRLYSDGSSDWDIAPLNQIVSIRSFAAVIILADDVEDAQVWVEQVEPLTRDEVNPAAEIPFIVIASAQAEPLLVPYTQTVPVQIDGLIAGMKGGAYYESRMGIGHVVSRYWDGYGIGLTVAVVVIGLSSVAGMGSGLFRRNREEDEIA